MRKILEKIQPTGMGYGIMAASFIVAYFVARGVLEMEGLSDSVRVLVALVPVPLFICFVVGFVRGIRNLDELERRIHLEALAIAFPLTLILLFTLGLLQLAVQLSPDDWSYRHLVPFVVVFYFGGLAFARRKYQ